MIKPFIVKRIHTKSKHLGNNLSRQEVKNKINYYNNLPQLKGYKILYDYIFMGYSNLSASSSLYHMIVISAKWIEDVIVYDDENVINAFIITLGHELAHKDGDFIGIFFNYNDRKFIHWVTEVHHDFAAAKKMVDSNRNKLLASMEYKIKSKPYSKNSYTHPSWQQRSIYAKTGVFNKVLIETIATDTGCTNEKLIYKVAEYYQDIILE